MRVPDIPMELVEWLEKYHPNSVMARGESVEEHLRRAGFQDCVYLLRQYAELQSQPEEALSNAERDLLFGEDEDDGDAPEPEGGPVRVNLRHNRHTR